MGKLGVFMKWLMTDDGDSKKVLEFRNKTFGDAAKAISVSNMWSDDKSECMKYLELNRESEYYEAVIAICKSNMWSDDKIIAIKNLKNV